MRSLARPYLVSELIFELFSGRIANNKSIQLLDQALILILQCDVFVVVEFVAVVVVVVNCIYSNTCNFSP